MADEPDTAPPLEPTHRVSPGGDVEVSTYLEIAQSREGEAAQEREGLRGKQRTDGALAPTRLQSRRIPLASRL